MKGHQAIAVIRGGVAMIKCSCGQLLPSPAAGGGLAQIEFMRHRLSAEITEVRADRDAWRALAHELAGHVAPLPPAPVPPPAPCRLRRLRGGSDEGDAR